MSQTNYNKKRKGRYLHRLPVSALIYIADNKMGWLGWCPLNNLWAAAHWNLGYQLFPTLRQGLTAIKWHDGDQASKHVADPVTRFKEVFHIGGLVYRVSGSSQEHKAQEFHFEPKDHRPLHFIKKPHHH